MSYSNQPIDPHDLPALAMEPWQPISPRYAWVLRIYLLTYGGVLLLASWLTVIATQTAPEPWMWWLTGAALVILTALFGVWAPRRVHFTRYLLRQEDVHMRTGYWWRKTISVAVNRIQHMEITQGPLERALGLSTLVLYTAGGYQSDLKLPGLRTADAHRLKAHLVHQVAREDAAGDVSD